MTNEEYIMLKNKYEFTTGGWDALWRSLAFMEFDAALEEFNLNNKDTWNGGEDLDDVSVHDVERIMDAYIERVEYTFTTIGTREMRNAIEAVTGLVC